MNDYTQEWNEYQRGIDYKRKINLYEEVNKAERFYSGRQWEGVKSNGLPTPVFNFIKRVGQYKISQIMQNAVAINYSIDGIEDDTENPYYQELKQVCEDLSDYTKTMWERMKMDSSNESILKDGYLSGDGITYYFWDDSLKLFDQEVEGDLAKEEIDNVNYFPGNPNDPEVQTQPYVIIAFRKMVSQVKEEAKRNGISQKDIDLISGDTDYQYQAGDRAKEELDGSEKCMVLLKLWKKDGRVWAKKSTRHTEIRKEWNTNLRRYPVALMNWELRKNSCHGVGEVTELIHNQIAINRLFAMAIISVMNTAYPKVIYDNTRIDDWSNQVGSAIGVNGDIANAANYLNPGQMSIDVYKMIDSLISYTKDMMGANETALGDNSITKTAAGIIALQKASAIPLESIKRRFYKYLEDVALIWIDFFINYYNVKRKLPVQRNEGQEMVEFDGSKYTDVAFRVKIDIGPSTQWSEITAIQTLDALLDRQIITPKQYFERMPNGIIPKKQELIEEMQDDAMRQEFILEMMARFVETLPPQLQMELNSLPPDQMEQRVMEMMMQPQQPQIQGGMM